MTVWQLVQLLSTYDPSATVVIEGMMEVMEHIETATLGDEGEVILKPGAVALELMDEHFREGYLRGAQSNGGQVIQPKVSGLGPSRTLEELFATSSRWVGTQPRRVDFPDGDSQRVSEWQELDCEIVKWLGDRYPIPIPFHPPGRGKRLFLNATPDHIHGKMDPLGQVKTIQVDGRVVYVFTKLSVTEHIQWLHDLVQAVGVDPGSVCIQLDQERPVAEVAVAHQ